MPLSIFRTASRRVSTGFLRLSQLGLQGSLKIPISTLLFASEVYLGYNIATNGRETMAIRITRAGVALTVGIIVVTGLIIGGLFLVKNQGEQARREEATQIAEQNLEEQTNEGAALNEGEPENQGEQNQGAANSETANGEVATNDGANANSNVGELPATGPADTSAVLALGLLTLSGVAYYRSRRALHHFDA